MHLKLGRRLVDEIRRHVGKRPPAIAHLLLAALGCQNAVTTNYDNLYEQAVSDSDSDAATVLPSEVPKPDGR